MPAMSTRGIHIIWTAYMTWPPDDPRGHWSPLFDLYGRLKQTGHRLNMPDPTTYGRAQTLAKEPPKVLAFEEIAVVAATLDTLLQQPPAHDPI